VSLYSGPLVVVGAAVLAGAGEPPSDAYARFCGTWFLAWGVALTPAALRSRA
jgi:hypothetical protein